MTIKCEHITYLLRKQNSIGIGALCHMHTNGHNERHERPKWIMQCSISHTHTHSRAKWATLIAELWEVEKLRARSLSFMHLFKNIRKSRYEDVCGGRGINGISSGFCVAVAVASTLLLMIMIAAKTHIQCKLIGNEKWNFPFSSASIAATQATRPDHLHF